jgi:eukaryotic-like serine/threonine-protein kinase
VSGLDSSGESGPRPLGGEGGAHAPGEGVAVAQDTPTASIDADHLTSPGAVMGTIAYTSPEQARGEVLDARTDLFSFGAVLYEMATGHPAFDGATSAVICHQILAEAPAPPLQLNPSLAPRLEEIILKALENDRDLRYQHASEMRTDLKRLKRDTDSGRSLAVAPGFGPAHADLKVGATAPSQEPTSDSLIIAGLMKRHKRGAVGTVVAVAVLAGLAWFFLHRTPQPSPPELTQTRLTFNSGEDTITSDTISPDGKYLTYSDLAGIHVKLVSTGEERVIPSPAGVATDAYWRAVSWFPDGTQLLATTSVPGAKASGRSQSWSNLHASFARAQKLGRSRRMGCASPSLQSPGPWVNFVKSG